MATSSSTCTSATCLLFSTTAAAIDHQSHYEIAKLPFTRPTAKSSRPITKILVSSSKPPTTTTAAATKINEETIFFDGGAHYGDLLANLLLGFTLLWQPLTLAAVLRAFYLRYRFTNLRVSVISGLTGQDRSDFSYDVIEDVQVVPRFIGE